MFRNNGFSREEFPLSLVGLFGVVLLMGGLLLGWIVYLWIVDAEARYGDRTGPVNEREVIEWMESAARAEQAFERAWLKTPEDPEVYRELERAIAIQAKLRALDPNNSFGAVTRYEKLVDRLKTTKGKFLSGRVHTLAEEAYRLIREGFPDRAMPLLKEALAAQEWINQHLQGNEWDSLEEVSRLREKLDELESKASADAIDLLVEKGEVAFAEALWDEAEEYWGQALGLQESFNFHFAQTRHARWRLVQEIKAHLQRVKAARANHRIESLLHAAADGGGSVDALERALSLQEEVNRQFPSTEFNRPDRLQDLRNRLSIEQSSALVASISQQIEALKVSLRNKEWETATSLRGHIEQLVRLFLDRFPPSLLPDEALLQRIEWLSQIEAEIPTLVEDIEKRLVPHPRLPGLEILKSEVDQALYSRIMGNNPSRWMGDDLPVDSISFHQAESFCHRLGWITGQTVQLPHLQWLTVPELHPGRKEGLWLSHSNQLRSQPVESSKLVGGLFDLYGNLEEWVLHPDQNKRTGLFGGHGSDDFEAIMLRPARWVDPHFRSRWTGFRFCILSPDSHRSDPDD